MTLVSWNDFLRNDLLSPSNIFPANFGSTSECPSYTKMSYSRPVTKIVGVTDTKLLTSFEGEMKLIREVQVN